MITWLLGPAGACEPLAIKTNKNSSSLGGSVDVGGQMGVLLVLLASLAPWVRKCPSQSRGALGSALQHCCWSLSPCHHQKHVPALGTFVHEVTE